MMNDLTEQYSATLIHEQALAHHLDLQSRPHASSMFTVGCRRSLRPPKGSDNVSLLAQYQGVRERRIMLGKVYFVYVCFWRIWRR